MVVPNNHGIFLLQIDPFWGVKWGYPYFLETPIFQFTANIEKKQNPHGSPDPWVDRNRYQTTGAPFAESLNRPGHGIHLGWTEAAVEMYPRLG